ncbi:peroxidase TAP [Coprinopsis sp. MPI-PUGE-AT-0042]|nr:peroxidase TAP [Coprinopsis sp. MPI-PUGE-AT-0042]KAH6903870.1 peroxidase TAP [Coprinopsis sp. MPI-PUGE-AT-0042]
MAEAQATLPPPAPAPGALDLKNIQGDIIGGLPKKTELYYFFQILKADRFRQDLAKFVPLVKTAQGVIEDRKRIEDHKKKNKPGLVPVVGINIAFSHLGFQAMGVDDTSLAAGDTDPFKLGQRQDAVNALGDNFVTSATGGKIPEWDPAFLQPVHGVILIAADSRENADENLTKIEEIFRADTHRASIAQVKLIRGNVRPGNLSAHEHFGFLDGISNPAVRGLDKELPGQGSVNPGVIVTGHDGDPLKQSRAPWAADGSFLVFRHLFQEVPEFNKYLKDHPIKFKNLTPEQGSELLGARMVGRWKSGAPIDITPFKDDPELAKDPQRNNNFKFEGQINSQFKCPFAAHIRKTNPRDDLQGPPAPIISVEPQRIMRRGIQFGPEVNPAEKASNTTQKGRGLLFVCYQSSIANGFQFMQRTWANNRNFQFKENQQEVPGLDPLIGQDPGQPRKMSGLDPNDPKKELTFPDFIIARGGEYFFSPSVKALKETLAKTTSVKA